MGCFTANTIDDGKNIKANNIIYKNKDKESEQKKRNDIASDLNESDDSEEKKRREKENILNINLHILIKNLEAKKVNPEEIKEKIENLFDSLLEKKEEEFNKDEMLEKVFNVFIDYLKPINDKNIKNVKYIINLLYENNSNPNNFSQNIFDILENINDYRNLEKKDEDKIAEYIIKKLGENNKIQNAKDKIKKIYKKNNYIIDYKNFTKIVKDNSIFIDNLAMEYLIYKMKCGLPLDEELLIDNLNLKVFLDFLDKSSEINEMNDNDKEKESNFLKESVLDNNCEKIGIVFKSP